jgi:hypothetical protein
VAKMTGKQRKALTEIALDLRDRIETGNGNREALECGAAFFWKAVWAAFGSDEGVLDIMYERDKLVEKREAAIKRCSGKE